MKGPGFDPWSGEIPCAAEQLRLCATAPMLRAGAPQESSPHSQQPKKALVQQQALSTPKNKWIHKIQSHLLKKKKERDQVQSVLHVLTKV